MSAVCPALEMFKHDCCDYVLALSHSLKTLATASQRFPASEKVGIGYLINIFPFSIKWRKTTKFIKAGAAAVRLDPCT